jgi:pimeloyl-ACP methyl ester carboxylesterase
MPSELPLILLHAWPLDARMWRSQVAALRPEGVTHALDLPGFGNEPDLDAPPSLDLWAGHLSEELRGMGISRAVFAGCSMGGYTALAMLRIDPALVAGLALVNSRAAADTEEQAANRAATVERIGREGTDFVVEGCALAVSPHTRESKPDVVAAMRVMASEASAEALMNAYRAIGARPDMRDELTGLSLPMAIIAGEDDPVVPLDEARRLAASIPRASFTQIAQAGHIAAMENPEVVTAALREFWKSVE